MNRNSIRRMYSRLSGEERFRLVVKAVAAGDGPEADYLIESCPTVAGTAPDPGFTGPGLASYRLVCAFARGCGPLLGWLEAVGVLEGVLTGEGARRSLPPETSFVAAVALDAVAEPAARDLRALLDAFAQVCRDRAGMEPHDLLGFWDPPLAALLARREGWIQGLEADRGPRDRFKAGLEQAWTLE